VQADFVGAEGLEATSTVRVNSSGAPNSATRPVRASRRSAIAAGALRRRSRRRRARSPARRRRRRLVEAPRRVGHPLRREVAGLWSARRGVYWIVYELKEADLLLNVVHTVRRADVYRPR
jgi:mRNA-degrading endonuclease RelE of RelBE toxin-antitoxin system